MPGSEEHTDVCQSMGPGEILKFHIKHSVLWTLALDSGQFLLTCS